MHLMTRWKKECRYPDWARVAAWFLVVVGIALAAGCGPSREEIMAMERARLEREERERQAEEARRKAEEEKMARLRALEDSGNEAARSGRFGKALDIYREVLGETARYGEQDQRVRMSLIQVVRAMSPPPPVPDGVMRSMVRGETMVKMGGAGNFTAAAEEIEDAVMAAPWLADAYYNLGIVQEKAEMYRKARQNFQLCLAAAPQSQNSAAIQAKIYALEVMEEDLQKLQSLAGTWKTSNGVEYKVLLEGRKIRIAGSRHDRLMDRYYQEIWYVFDLEKKGNSLEGTVSISRESDHGCNFPEDTGPVSGVIGTGGNSIRLEWKESRFSWTWQGTVCTGVSSLGKQMNILDLVSQTGKPHAAEEAKTSGTPTKIKKRSR